MLPTDLGPICLCFTHENAVAQRWIYLPEFSLGGGERNGAERILTSKLRTKRAQLIYQKLVDRKRKLSRKFPSGTFH